MTCLWRRTFAWLVCSLALCSAASLAGQATALGTALADGLPLLAALGAAPAQRLEADPLLGPQQSVPAVALLTNDVSAKRVAAHACKEQFAPPAEHHVDPFGVLRLKDLWPANSTSRVRPRPLPVGAAYNSSDFDVFVNSTYVALNSTSYVSQPIFNNSFPPGAANFINTNFRLASEVLYPLGILWSLTSNYQINAPPPLGHPACQFPELTLLGVCGSLVIYFPSPPNATVDDLADVMAKVKHMPELRSAWVRAGVPPVMPPGHMRREVVTGSLGPIGRFRSPMPTRTNASTLHLYGLRAFAAWQVEATKGALWDAYAEVAIHMEILQVQLVAPGSANAKGAKASCSPEEGLCAPCGAVLDSPSVGLTFSYEYFDAIELHSDFERYRPVLTREFAEDLHSRGVDATAVRIEPDEALRGLLACEDISLCCHGDGSPWLLGCGAHGKVYRALRNGVQDAAVKLLTN
ncbi:hypothetical protein WJX81_007036, partial [Elliptochloris bilobata]